MFCTSTIIQEARVMKLLEPEERKPKVEKKVPPPQKKYVYSKLLGNCQVGLSKTLQSRALAKYSSA